MQPGGHQVSHFSPKGQLIATPQKRQRRGSRRFAVVACLHHGHLSGLSATSRSPVDFAERRCQRAVCPFLIAQVSWSAEPCGASSGFGLHGVDHSLPGFLDFTLLEYMFFFSYLLNEEFKHFVDQSDQSSQEVIRVKVGSCIGASWVVSLECLASFSLEV